MKLLRILASPGLICAAVLIVFGQVTSFTFVNMDDPIYVSENPAMHDVTGAGIWKFWTASYHELYTPLAYTAWSGVAWISGSEGGHLDPALFHLLNLSLHLVSSLLVLAILFFYTRDRLAATLGALLWAIHPTQTEAIAWVGMMKDSLFVCLGLASVLLALRNRWLAAWIFFVLSLLSKPTAVVIPLVLFTLATGITGQNRRAVLRRLWPWALTALPFAFAFTQHQPDHLIDSGSPWLSRIGVASDALGFYSRHVIVPHSLSLDYGRFPRIVLSDSLWSFSGAYFSCLFIVLLAGGLWLGRRKFGYRPLALLSLFIGALFPVLGFKLFTFQEISTVADRYLILPLLAPALGAAFAIADLRRWKDGRAFQPAIALLGLIIVGYAFSAHTYAAVWKNSESLMTHVIATNPRSFVAHHNLGKVREDAGDLVGAETHYQQAIALHAMPESFHGLGSVLLKTGRYEEAVVAHRRAVELAPQRAYLHTNLAVALVKSGRIDEGKSELRIALQLDPEYVVARENLRRLDNRN